MSTSRDVRRAKFAAFVDMAIRGARSQRGWTVAQILDATNVGKTTLYRWLNATWAEDPEAAKVRDFCDGLGIPVEHAFRILWPSRADRPQPPEPTPMDPDLERLLRKLHDPRTGDATRAFILHNLRGLADIVETQPTQPPRRRRAG